jgi:hypothetical protein
MIQNIKSRLITAGSRYVWNVRNSLRIYSKGVVERLKLVGTAMHNIMMEIRDIKKDWKENVILEVVQSENRIIRSNYNNGLSRRCGKKVKSQAPIKRISRGG